MAPGTQKSAAAKFYQEDIIQRIDDPTTYGVVLRCWQDVKDLPSLADHVDPPMRPLVQGEVGVSYFLRRVREIISEDKLALVDRLYQPGDLLKRSVDDVHSGIVTGVNVRARLNHAISGEAIPGWKSMDDIEAAVEVDIGDYVVYDDWVGQVVEMFDEAWVEVSGGNVIRLPELSARLAIGEKGPDILPQPTFVQGIFGFLLGSTGPSSADTVVSVKHTVLAVAWLAVNQSLPPNEAQARPRPQRYWHSNDLGKLTIVSRRAEEAMRVGNRVRLRDSTGVPVTRHGKLTEPQNIVEVDTLIIQETKTTVEVLWQDGSRETLDARETVPYLNPDEYDCWPGDHVVWKTEDSKQHVVVQSVNAQDRTARVRVVATGAIELASVLELDAHGSNDWSAVNPGNDGLGVRRGDLAFIHREGTANGAVPPTVPKIGEVEEWVRETPTVGANGQLGGWRRHMADIGTRIAEERGKEQHGEEPPIQRPQKDDTSLNWFGEVIGLRLDGTVEVMLPNSQILNVTLNRLTRLYDSVEQLEDLWGDDEGTVDEGEGVEVGEMDEDGRWVEGDAADDDEWEDEEMADAVDESAGGEWSPSTDTVIPPLHVETPMVVDSAIPLDGSRPTSSSGRPHSPDVPKDATDMDEEAVEEIETPWKRFEILSTAPSDHAPYNNAPAQPSRNFMTRLTKEYKALQSSLPDSILVRAYEDRADLLCSLIIGPENTPYEDAPFVIDWMQDSNFPDSTDSTLPELDQREWQSQP